MTDPSMEQSLAGERWKITACYVLSGALGLIYQVLWLRKLLLVFGSTVHAVSTILTVFFGGLALGSWLFGRLIDRHESAGLRWYALLEAGVGAYALMTLWLMDAVRQLYLPWYQASGFSPSVLIAGSFCCALFVLLFPTTLLGGTFPVLSRYLIRSSQGRGAGVARLYGLNTAGAMVGTLLVYYIGLPMLGLRTTLQCAAVLSIGIGLLCLTIDHRLGPLPAMPVATAVSPVRSTLHEGVSTNVTPWLLVSFGLSGFSALVYEVAWTRALGLVLGSSIYAFCLILTTFLGGIALGSLVIQNRLRRQPARLVDVVLLELGLGIYGLLSLPLMNRLPDAFVRLWPVLAGSFTGLTWLQLFLSATILLLPTVLMGMLFPVVSELVANRQAQLGQQLGNAYAVNTLGGIAGSFVTGFVLIPHLGLPWTIVVAALANLIAGSLIYLCDGWPMKRVALAGSGLAAAVAAAQLIFVPSWHRQLFAAGVYLDAATYGGRSVSQGIADSTLLYYRDSLNTTVSVHQNGSTRYLKVGGKTDASNGADMGTQVLSAHVPLLLHGHANDVLVIGLGSGVTLGHAGRYPAQTLHCAEIDPAVIEGARFFQAYNYGVHHDPRVHIFVADGRNFLLASRHQYDVIISEPSNPWMAGLGYLFTREFYQLAKQRLAPGGLMCQWLQLYKIFPSDVKLMLKTFHNEFPYMSVWSSVPGDLLLVGSLQPQTIPYQELAQRMAVPAVHDALATVRTDRPDVLLESYLFGGQQVEQMTADVIGLHEDDQPWIEFSAPRALYGSSFAVNYDGMAQFKARADDLVPGASAREQDPTFYQAAAAWMVFREEPKKALPLLERAVVLDPTLTSAWVELGRIALRLQHFERAEQALFTASRLDPARRESYRLLGQLHWRQQQLTQAEQWYKRAAIGAPPDAALAEEIGNCLLANAHPALAAEFFRSAVSQSDDDQPRVMTAFADALRQAGQAGESQAILEQMVAHDPDAALFVLLGQVQVAQRQWAPAIASFRHGLALAPYNADAYYGAAQAAIGQGRRPDAIRFLRMAVRYQPYHQHALELLAGLTANRPGSLAQR